MWSARSGISTILQTVSITINSGGTKPDTSSKAACSQRRSLSAPVAVTPGRLGDGNPRRNMRFRLLAFGAAMPTSSQKHPRPSNALRSCWAKARRTSSRFAKPCSGRDFCNFLTDFRFFDPHLGVFLVSLCLLLLYFSLSLITYC